MKLLLFIIIEQSNCGTTASLSFNINNKDNQIKVIKTALNLRLLKSSSFMTDLDMTHMALGIMVMARYFLLRVIFSGYGDIGYCK